MRTNFLGLIRAAFYLPFVLLTLASGGVRADEYPSHPIKLIVPFAAGGPSDVTARWRKSCRAGWGSRSSWKISAERVAMSGRCAHHSPALTASR